MGFSFFLMMLTVFVQSLIRLYIMFNLLDTMADGGMTFAAKNQTDGL